MGSHPVTNMDRPWRRNGHIELFSKTMAMAFLSVVFLTSYVLSGFPVIAFANIVVAGWVP